MTDIYLIRWIDAYQIDRRHTTEEMIEKAERGFEVISVGFLFKETLTYLSLIQNYEGESVSGMISIPLSCIKEKTKIS